jgi:caa(3)-type oxidase subunit IV
MASAAHDAHGHEAHHGGGDHVIHEPSHYVRIWAILCVLLVVSVAGPMLEIQIITLITAFGIAFVKASMVVKYFMHLDIERPIIWYILATSLAFMVLFFAAVSPDVMEHEGTNWENLSARHEIERALREGEGGGHGSGHAPDGHAPEGHGAPEGHAAPAGH